MGKLKLPNDYLKVIEMEDIEHMPFTATQAQELDKMDLHHRDPFDRMLIGQAVADQTAL